MKIILKFLLILLIMWPVYAQSQEPARRPIEIGKVQQNLPTKEKIQPSNEQRGTDDSPLVVKIVGAPASKTEKSNDAKNTSNKSAANWWPKPTDLLLIIFNGLLAVFTYLLWRSTNKMWKSTKDAAAAAKKSADALPTIERAYVFVDACTPEHTDANMFEIAVSFSNFGKTPAILTKVHGEFVWGEQSPSKLPEIKLPFPAGSVVLKPNSSELIKFRAYVPPDILGKIERKCIRSFCCGLIEYHDIWKVQHETGFCWEVSPVGPHGRITDSPLNYYT